MKNVSFLMISMIVILFLAGSQASASTQGPNIEIVTLAASKDNTLYEDDEGLLSNGAGDYFFSGVASNNFGFSALRRGVIAFESVDAIPAGSLILDAELTLHMSRGVVGSYPVELHVLLSDWGEAGSDAALQEGKGALAESGDATWLHKFYDDEFWQKPGGDFAATPSATTIVDDIGSYTWSGPDIIDDLYGWMLDPGSNFGWVLVNESDINTAKRFNSRENSSAELQPKLVVTYLPSDQVERLYLPVITKN